MSFHVPGTIIRAANAENSSTPTDQAESRSGGIRPFVCLEYLVNVIMHIHPIV